MIHKCAFIGNRFVSAVFSVAGIDVFPVDGPAEARKKISSLLENAEIMGEPYGLVLVEGVCWNALDAKSRDAFSRKQNPIVVPVNLAEAMNGSGAANPAVSAAGSPIKAAAPEKEKE